MSRTRSIVARAAGADDSIGELCGRILEGAQRIHLAPTDATVGLEALVAEALPVFEAAGDDLALRIAYRALGDAANMRAQMDQVAAAYEQAASYDSPAGLTGLVGYQSHARFFGSTPLTALLAWQSEQDTHEQRGYFLGAHRCLAFAMLGRIDEARALLAELRAELSERGGAAAMVGGIEGYGMVVEFLAGDLEAAAAAGEKSCRLLDELGRLSESSTTAGGLAGVYYELGRLDDAERLAARAGELGAEEDAVTQMLWRRARARVLAKRGKYDEAERLAREAVEVGETTEDLNSKAETWADLGEVLMLAGRPLEAAEALEQAIARFEAKENLVMAGRMRERLAALRAGVS